MSRIVIARSDTASTQPHIALDASHWHVWARTRQRQSRRQYGKRPPTDAALLLDNVRLQRVAFRAFEGAKLPPAAIRKQIASDLLVSTASLNAGSGHMTRPPTTAAYFFSSESSGCAVAAAVVRPAGALRCPAMASRQGAGPWMVSPAPATTLPIGCLSNRWPQTGVETHRLVQSSHQASRPRLSNADRHQVPRRKLAFWAPCSYRVGDQIRSRMILNTSRVRKPVQTALTPKPQINPAIRISFSGIENMGQAPHVFPSLRISLQCNSLFPHRTTSQSCRMSVGTSAPPTRKNVWPQPRREKRRISAVDWQ